MINMLVVDDEYYIRLGIKNAIDWSSIGVNIVGEAEDGEQGYEQALKLQPDIILIDICMPFLDGIQLMEKLNESNLDCGIIVLSGFDEFQYAQKAIKNGVLDYLLKPIEKDKLMDSVLKASKIIHKKRSTHHYQNLIAQETTVIRSQFLRDLIIGNIPSEEELLKRIENLNIPLGNGICQAVCVKLDDFNLLERQLLPEEIQNLRKSITYHLSEHLLLGQSYVGMLVDISPEEWCVVLTYLANAAGDQKELQQNILSVIKALDEIAPYTVSISVSHLCPAVHQISEAFQKARTTNKKFIPSTNSVVYPDMEQIEGIRPEVQAAVIYIKQHFKEDITVQIVAEKLYLSPSYFMHIFKNDLGKTFNTFLTEYRLEVAKELLQEPGSKIYEIAQQVGYQDVKYFNKIFKRHTQLSPRDYVRLHYADF
jgi:two-component system, response regulator YesN